MQRRPAASPLMLLHLQLSSSSNLPRVFLTLKILSLLTCRAAEIRRVKRVKSAGAEVLIKRGQGANNERVQPTPVVTGISQLNPTFQVSSVKAARPIRAAALDTLLKGIMRQRGDQTLVTVGLKWENASFLPLIRFSIFASMTNQSHSSSVAHTLQKRINVFGSR